MANANESNTGKFIKLVSTGLLDLHLTLTLSDQEAEFFQVFPEKLDKLADCASFLSSQGNNLFMTSSQIESKRLSIFDHIRLSSNNNTINSLLVLNRAFKKKIFVEYVTMNEVKFFDEHFFMKDLLKYVTEQNFLFLVENKFLKNSQSQIRFEIKINNKTVKLFENICDDSNTDNSIRIDEVRSDSNNNLNNFNINLNNFNNSNTYFENNNEDINKNENTENDNNNNKANSIENNSIEKNHNYINDNNNNSINQSRLKNSNSILNENNEKSNEKIEFSIKEKDELLPNNLNNTENQNKSKLTGSKQNSIINNDTKNYNNNNNQQFSENQNLNKQTSKLSIDNDLTQTNINLTKSASKRIESNNQRSLAESNNDFLNNMENTAEKFIEENKNNQENLNLATNTNNILINEDHNEQIKTNQKHSTDSEQMDLERLGNEINMDILPQTQMNPDLISNRLLNSFDKKLTNESNTNNKSNKSLNINEINSKMVNPVYNSEEAREKYNNQINENNISNNADNKIIPQMDEEEILNNENLCNNNNTNTNILAGLQQKSSSGVAINDISNSPNFSPNTNFTNTLIKMPKTVYERFRYDFSGCNYFFVDLNEINSLKNYNFSLNDFLELLKKITSDFREISIITSFPSIIKNIALLDLESLTYISEIVSLTDVYIFEKKEALALFNLLAQLNSETDSVEEKKNLEFLFIREIKRKKRPYPKFGIFLEGMKKCTLIQQQQNTNLIVLHTDYEFNLIPPNVSSVVFEDYQKIFLNNADYLTAVFLGGFFSRFFYKKTFNTCFTAGNESLKRIIELIRFNVEPPLDFNFYLIRIKKNPKPLTEEEKLKKKKEENFVLDSTNLVNSKMRIYNPLYDSNCVSFFSSKLTRTHLQKHGFINRNGVITDDPENKKITIMENFDSKNFEKIYEQEKNNLQKIKEQKEKMRLQIKSLMNINNQTLRTGSLKELDKLAKIYTFNPSLKKKLPNIDLKRSTMKSTKFNNNLFLKEISKGKKPKSLFKVNPAAITAENNDGYKKSLNLNDHKPNKNDLLIPREKTVTNSVNRITSYNNRITGKTNERENSANNLNNASNIRIKSGNNNQSSVNSANVNKSKIRITASNKRTDSNYSKKQNNNEDENLVEKIENQENYDQIKAEDDENLNNNEINLNQKDNIEVNENNNQLHNENKEFENGDNHLEILVNKTDNNILANKSNKKLNLSKLSENTKSEVNKSALINSNNQLANKILSRNGSEKQPVKDINGLNIENKKEELQNYLTNTENKSQINSSRNGHKLSNADLNLSKRSRKFDVSNNSEFENSRKIKNEENFLIPVTNENKENSGIKIDSKRSDERDREIDLKNVITANDLHPNQID